jgi:hypothetical protein
MKQEYPEKNYDKLQVTDKLYHIFTGFRGALNVIAKILKENNFL